MIARVGVGYDAVDTASATEHGVAVTTTPGANHDAVAEHTLALILAIVKGVVTQHNAAKAGSWPRTTNLPLRGRTLGIAGLGRIGKAVALRGECFGMKLLAYEPVPDPAFVQQHRITLVSFEELLAEADFVSLHMPLSPQSRHIINKQSLGRMKPTAFLINTAGAAWFVKPILWRRCAKRLAGAALDRIRARAARPEQSAVGIRQRCAHAARGGGRCAVARRHGGHGGAFDRRAEQGRVASRANCESRRSFPLSVAIN